MRNSYSNVTGISWGNSVLTVGVSSCLQAIFMSNNAKVIIYFMLLFPFVWIFQRRNCLFGMLLITSVCVCGCVSVSHHAVTDVMSQGLGINYVSFQVLTMASMNIKVIFWDVCTFLISVHRCTPVGLNTGNNYRTHICFIAHLPPPFEIYKK
jgi:hypothetical protein